METTFWHPSKHCHLGDLVTIVQSLHILPGKKVIFGNRTCRCGCGRKQEDTLPQIISLLDTQVEWGGRNIPEGAVGIDPVWDTKGENNTYVKAKYLPTYHEKLVTVQFTPVMRDGERALSQEVTIRIFNVLKNKGVERNHVLNLSEATIFEAPSPFWGMEPSHGGVIGKFDMISRAKLHISADSGTAHLAAMTDTPTVVLCPSRLFNRYRTQTNVICCSHVREVEIAAASVLDSLWLK
jgi:hypothetical protein